MSSGINFDEQKRQQQFMNMKAQQQMEKKQNLDFSTKRKKQTNVKDLVVTICIVLGLLLLMILFSSR